VGQRLDGAEDPAREGRHREEGESGAEEYARDEPAMDASDELRLFAGGERGEEIELGACQAHGPPSHGGGMSLDVDLDLPRPDPGRLLVGAPGAPQDRPHARYDLARRKGLRDELMTSRSFGRTPS
jgi:hypothetical protein